MKYLLDTNVCISLMEDQNATVRFAFTDALLSGDELYLSSVSVYELTYGAWKSARQHYSQGRLRDFLAQEIVVLSLDETDAATAGHIQSELERGKSPLGPFDTLIAGQALARGLMLVTANTREFSRVDGLKWIDWSE